MAKSLGHIEDLAQRADQHQQETWKLTATQKVSCAFSKLLLTLLSHSDGS